MSFEWKSFLQQDGAVFDADSLQSFGNLKLELRACKENALVVSPLFHLAILQISGIDAAEFLHNQLTSDIKKLTPGLSQYSSYCTPQGRVLANFLVWQKDSENLFIGLPAELAKTIQERLSKFILRSKVKIFNINNDLLFIGVAGQSAEALVRENIGAVITNNHEAIYFKDKVIIKLLNHFIIGAPLPAAIELWKNIHKDALSIGEAAWQWLEIKNGIPAVNLKTQEEFIPQMLNLDKIGAISFEKGCYPGQEIVARTKYLGKLKKQLYLAHISSDDTPLAGDRLYGHDMQDACGMIVNATDSPDGGFDTLAVIQTSSVESGKIHWKSLNGPSLMITSISHV